MKEAREAVVKRSVGRRISGDVQVDVVERVVVQSFFAGSAGVDVESQEVGLGSLDGGSQGHRIVGAVGGARRLLGKERERGREDGVILWLY